ncbi:AAA family ATPase [Clostridium beijerinckii]|uniref:AAA family ATPase n=1 Tax=Clostridium beijerinckii TaxID=1520 RepID=UPI00098C109B|nr:AAA family ATPase [Clostridium beijerinckii]NRT79457.1 putative ATPase [Clostridium beijerinckii]OOM41533.1 hypothetical protein CBEIJ_44630 [Clostridium beijerinckii]
MQIYLKVESFGKIKSAKININSYTIFVGNNNSGKTYLMELIDGVLKYVSNKNEWISTSLEKSLKYVLQKSYYKVDSYFIGLLQESINKYLNKNKNDIIYSIFKNDIHITSLNFEFSLDKNEEFEVNSYGKNNLKELLDITRKNKFFNDKGLQNIIEKQKDLYGISVRKTNLEDRSKNDDGFMIGFDSKFREEGIINYIFDYIILKGRRNGQLFIPASRTGLLLLYREFFAKKADDAVIISSEEQKKDDYGLTIPVYNFLRFLQTYKNNLKIRKKNKDIIEFIEEKIIDGHLVNEDGEVLYISNKNKVKIPLYLTSSMVNELTPIIWALSDERDIDTLILDEIETSLHPEKQVEIARLLNRMNNNGINLIISTHSDTMATKINNLFILSFADLEKDRKMKMLKELNLMEDDLLDKSKKVNVYQFTNQEDGTSIVQELNFDKYTGYNFDMFTDTVINLYEESKTIMEI